MAISRRFITISLAFSIAAAVGFSPLSILAMATILSSVFNKRTPVVMELSFTALNTI